MQVYGASSSNSTAATKSTGNSALGKDEFLKILLTQLQYQDPMSPMQDKDFIAQMAQFSALEQMTNMAAGFEKLQKVNSLGAAFNLLGTTVTYRNSDGNDVTGTVTGAEMKDGVMKVKVGEAFVDLLDIVKVTK
ncbi:flagellar hook assembly protein FlgD [Effusibacillus lacus]|uniref:Flagellar hook assembly protein FlgD n=1 Tax=Effusibacillus lacus TaxID=1348429 RepID=A0A292YKR0_9BACL|nr:flagellar hook assembly protein FlgD [Effusibacillus lacus]TCS73123.1 flagellar basal-body rod modification protein FlgD [Effusibacillus lacus]GAX90528.1 flagellar hook assembly protein FlgD [Effusibacillus lacus]